MRKYHEKIRSTRGTSQIGILSLVLHIKLGVFLHVETIILI